MSYRIEQEQKGTQAIVIEGFENGIASSPHKGIANMQGVNIATESGEAMCSFNRIAQNQVGTNGTLARVNTNTVSISGIALNVGQVITILNPGTTGLSGNYYYLSTGKLYAGSLPPSTPDSATAVTGINAGIATFSITYPLGQPIQSATESYYRTLSSTLYYRYYILDSLGNIWCHDTYTLVNWVTPLWFFAGTGGAGASGLAYFNGWVTISNGTTISYWKLSSLLGMDWLNAALTTYTTPSPINFFSNSDHVMLSSNQGKLYGTDGRYITSLFPNTSLTTGAANIQSYCKYSAAALGADTIVNGSFTGSATGWTLAAGWTYSANTVLKSGAGTGTLSQLVPTIKNSVYQITFTMSATTVEGLTVEFQNGLSSAQFTADGTYTVGITAPFTTTTPLRFVPISTNSRFTIDNISMKLIGKGSISAIISGSVPSTGNIITPTRIPAVFYSSGTLPTSLTANPTKRYYIEWFSNTDFNLYNDFTGQTGLDFSTGATGDQYFVTFSPINSALYTFSSQRLNLPFTETATSLAEIGNTVMVGGITNQIYPWDQVSTLPGDIIFLPEAGAKKIITVNNTAYIFAGNKGNIYISNGSSTAGSLKVPDYCAGIAGSPSTYIEPYFTWGDAVYCRGRVYFSILDQTSIKTGNCGGIWSFVPTQNFFVGQDTGQAPRMDNQNSYGTYNGIATVLIGNQEQNAISPQFWSGWYSSISSPTYGIDYTDVIPEEATIIESDLIPTGTSLDQKTFSQIEYKLSSDLVSGESIVIKYRQNSTDAWVSVGTAQVEGPTELSGILPVNFQKGQWLQLQATLVPIPSSSSSFCRLKELRIR